MINTSRPQPIFNTNVLTGVVSHALQVCGALSAPALDMLVRRYAYARGKKLPPMFAQNSLLPTMLKSHQIYRTTKTLYSLNFMCKANSKGATAFWVFLQHMEDVDIDSLAQGPAPAQLSYIKNNRIYHIIVCENDGANEIAMANQLEIDAATRARILPATPKTDMRFFFVFTNEESLRDAKIHLKTPYMRCLVQKVAGKDLPLIKFFSDADLEQK